jgi:membrane protein YdbS with pleckstrin-like domain
LKLDSITAALIAAALLGMWFSATRWIAIAAAAALCLLFPWLVVLVIVGVAWAFHFFKVRNQHRR